MSTPSLAEAGPLPLAADGTSGATGLHPAVAAVGSALLLWTTFPPADWGWFAWVALVPLFLLVVSRRSRLSLYLGAWAGGFVFWGLAVQWVRLTDESAWLGWLAMAGALSVFWPLFLALSRLAVLRLRLPLMVAAPVVWVALEYARAYILSGFPWYYLAHSQHLTLPVIQVADVAGSLGVSVVIAVVNAWVVDLLTLPLLRPTPRGARPTPRQWFRFGVVAVLVGGTLGYGAFRLGTSRFRPGPRVALLQSSLLQHLKESRDPDDIVAIYRNLVDRALRAENRPDLVVWPETSYPFSYVTIDPATGPEELASQAREINPKFTTAQRIEQRNKIAAHLHAWADQAGVPMLVGGITGVHRPGGYSKYNSAMLFAPGVATAQVFHKMHLVPFGEYVPLIGTFPWLTMLTPYRGSQVPSLAFGREATTLTLGPYRLAPVICFEDTVPHVVRQFFRDTKDGRPPDLLVNMSNDGWFQGSSEHDMHLAVSVFRCVENRVPLVRAANTGVSAIVDGNGRVLASLPKLKEAVLAGIVPLDDRSGVYSAWGDWLGQSCLAVTIGLIPLAMLRSRLRPRLAV